jgi:hypothetical protein
MPALEFAHDQLAIAIDVCADLQHGRLAVKLRRMREVMTMIAVRQGLLPPEEMEQ